MKHYSALEEIFKIYESSGFVIARIHADQEFKPVVLQLQEDGKMAAFIVSNAQEHQLHVEQNYRTIQEQVRAVFHSLSHQDLPIKQIELHSTKRRDLSLLQPREIVSGRD